MVKVAIGLVLASLTILALLGDFKRVSALEAKIERRKQR